MLPQKKFTYPSKRTERPGGNFTVRQFILPIRLRGHLLWALLDTGANISILPREVADDISNFKVKNSADGEYSLAGLVKVPYQSYKLNFEILEYVEGTIPQLDLSPYKPNPSIATSLSKVEFQMPLLTWPEIANRLNATSPVSIESAPVPWVILGLYGVLEQLSLSFIGHNSVTLSTFP